ncbi:MAG: DUF6291 domain-containing protein [Lachnospiraceae bacterium]|nr:DUF6291 domain-containing protein [Lachnospiraceae bacterium]
MASAKSRLNNERTSKKLRKSIMLPIQKAMSGLSVEQQEKIMRALIEYRQSDIEPKELDPLTHCAFFLIKPKIDAVYHKHKNDN